MAADATEVRVGVTGTLYRAPIGTTAPDDTGTPWGVAFVELGYLSEDGPGLQPSSSTKDINVWQSFFPVRSLNTARGMEWTFKLMQRNPLTLQTAFGGGEITDLGGGDSQYDPPAPGEIDEFMLGLEVIDGDIIDRYILDRGTVTAIGKVPFKKDDATAFDVTVKALEANEGKPWRLISNDPALG